MLDLVAGGDAVMATHAARADAEGGHSMTGLYILTALAGLSFIFQQAVNSNLRLEIGSPWWAGFVSYLGGTVVMLIVAIVLREPWASAEAIGRSSWISWSGGFFGAVYIAISILMLPRLGAATVVSLIILGQMLGALVFDHFGLLGVAEHPVTAVRLLGVLLLLSGVVLIRF
jgi:bacterial/archaeal transporter family-2 protein